MISNVNSLAIVTSSICEPLATVMSHWSIILTLYLWTLSSSQWRCQPGRFSMAAHRNDRRGARQWGRKRPHDGRPHSCCAGSGSIYHSSADRIVVNSNSYNLVTTTSELIISKQERAHEMSNAMLKYGFTSLTRTHTCMWEYATFTWQEGSRSILAQVMACCLTAPSHYLNQYWLMVSEVFWHSLDSNLLIWDCNHIPQGPRS